MFWFLLAVVGYAFLAVVFILDKLIVSTAKQKPVVYAFYTSIFMLAALLLFPVVGFGWLKGTGWLLAVISGVSFGLAMWTLFIADSKGETSHISPFNGAFVTLFIFFLGAVFLGERLTSFQIGGVVILMLASLLLSSEKSREHNGFHVGFVWAIVSGLFFAISHVSAKYLYLEYPFWTGFIWSKATTGLVGLFLLFYKDVRNALFKKSPPKADPPLAEKTNYAVRHGVAIIIANKLLSVVAIILLQYAISIGSVTLVNALSGLQYALMFVLIYLLTKFLPKVFNEYFTRREIIIEVVAIILVVIGSAFFVF